MTTLSTFSQLLSENVANAASGVARVEARPRLSASGLVWSADGLIVTAHHVLEREENIRVGLEDGRVVNAALVGRDPRTDIAVLRAEAGDLAPLRWADADSLRVGHLALALGRPGQSVQATLGILSVVGDGRRLPTGGLLDKHIQSDAEMYPGFSGGPLLGADGTVMGMNTTMLLRGASLTLPHATVARIVDALVANGHVRRGWLGIGAQPVRLPSSLEAQLGQETGLMLASVEQGSPAERGGLVMGDVVVKLDGQPIRTLDELLSVLGEEIIGKDTQVTVIRGGQVSQLRLTVGERG